MFAWKFARSSENICKFRQKCRISVGGWHWGINVIDAFDQIQFDAGWQAYDDGGFVVDDVEIDVVELTFVVHLQCCDATWSRWRSICVAGQKF